MLTCGGKVHYRIGLRSLHVCWVGYVGVLKCVCVKIGMDIIVFGLGAERGNHIKI